MSEALQLGKIRVTVNRPWFTEAADPDLFSKMRTRYRRAVARQEPLNRTLEALRIEILAAGASATIAVGGKPWPNPDATTPNFSRIFPRRKSPNHSVQVPLLSRCKHGRYPSPRHPCGKCALEWVRRAERRANALIRRSEPYSGPMHHGAGANPAPVTSQASFEWQAYNSQLANLC